jgi:hypothetical protein
MGLWRVGWNLSFIQQLDGYSNGASHLEYEGLDIKIHDRQGLQIILMSFVHKFPEYARWNNNVLPEFV